MNAGQSGHLGPFPHQQPKIHFLPFTMYVYPHLTTEELIKSFIKFDIGEFY
jgi:hypothetical protein